MAAGLQGSVSCPGSTVGQRQELLELEQQNLLLFVSSSGVSLWALLMFYLLKPICALLCAAHEGYWKEIGK